jgi:hypothetical protein
LNLLPFFLVLPSFVSGSFFHSKSIHCAY